MRRWLIVLVVLVIACNQSTPSSVVNQASQARTLPSQSPSGISRDLPVATIGFTCRLPVSIGIAGGSSVQGGFLSFPSGSLTMDPAGSGGRYFDLAFSKWLPVDRNAVAPDGRHYAFGSQTAQGKPQLHVVSVPGGDDRVYDLPTAMFYAIGGIYVIDFQPNKVYMGLFVEGGVIGIWVLNLTTGQTVRFAAPENAWVMDGNVVWGSGFDHADSNPLSFPPGFVANEVERFDTSDGSTTTWLYRPGNLVGVMGVDRAHHPIVGVLIDKETAELLLLLDARTQQTIYRGSSNSWIGNIDSIGGGIISDGHGLWMGAGPYGLYLYSPNAGVQRVSDLQSIRPANGCF